MFKFLYSAPIKNLFIITMLFLSSNSTMLFADDSDFETNGNIASIFPDSLVVNGYHIVIDEYTEVKDHNTGDINFSDLQAGDYVEVKGQILSGGKYYAEKIERENEEIEMEGVISSVGVDYLEMNDVQFFVSGSTKVKSKYGIRISFSDLRAGLSIEIKGYRSNTVIIASEIKLHERHFEHHLEIKGKIDSVVSDGIIINQNHILVTDETIIRLRHDQPGGLSDLSADTFVEVKAAWLTDGSLFAIRIKTENNFENELEIIGQIDSLGSNFLYVLNYNVMIDSLTHIVNDAGQVIDFNDLEKGQRVKINGTLIGQNLIIADRIKVKSFFENELEFTGKITFLSPDQITVEQTNFSIDASTIILDHNNNVISFDLLSVGQTVEIKGTYNPGNTLYAVRIKLEDIEQDELEFTGAIENISADLITVNGVDFSLSNFTIVLDLQNNLISIFDLAIGQTVEIKGVLQLSGTYNAVRIKIEDTPGLLNFTGNITDFNSNSVIINNTNYQLTQQTVFLNNSYSQVNNSIFSPNDEVTIWALQTNDGQYSTLQLKLGKSSLVSGLDGGETIHAPELFELKNNYPNPFNPETTIAFSLNVNGFIQVKLTVFDISGQQIRTLFNGLLDNGQYSFKWDAKNEFGSEVASGTYFYQLSVGHSLKTAKMTLLR